MKFAMILAAGEGRRMRPLTYNMPKSLIQVAGKTLLERHIEDLVSAGFTDLVINASYLSDQVVAFVVMVSNGAAAFISRLRRRP